MQYALFKSIDIPGCIFTHKVADAGIAFPMLKNLAMSYECPRQEQNQKQKNELDEGTVFKQVTP
jgi:hypothetical protein